MATGIPTRPGPEKPSVGVTGPFSGSPGPSDDVDMAIGALAALGADLTAQGATAPSPDGDDIEDDPRVVAISLALQENAELWARTVDGEVQLDTEVVAIIALATLGEGYCSERCHDEEYQAIVGYVRGYTSRSGTDCSCRDEILAGIEAASGVKDDPER